MKLRHFAAAATMAALAIAGPATSQNAAWTQDYEPVKLFDNVYWVGSAGLASYLFTSPQGHILLDVGVPENAEMVERHIRGLGFKVEDIKIILNSHAHFDHSGGIAKVKADSGAQFWAAEGDRYSLEKGVYEGSETQANLNFPPVKVDRVVKEGDKATVGPITLTARMTPGHSKGCTSWGFTVTDQGRARQALVFCSGSVALNRIGTANPQYPEIVANYRSTFAKMKALSVDIYLAPHSEMFDLPGKKARIRAGEPSPFIVAGEKDRAIAAFETAFNTALARAEAPAAAPKAAVK